MAARVVIILRNHRALYLVVLVTARGAIILRTFWVSKRGICTAKIHNFLLNLTCRIRGPWRRNTKCHILPPRCRIANIWCRHVNIYGGLPTWLIWINKNISFYSSEYCVFNIIIIFWFMILSELGPKEQCSKIVNFNRSEAGLTSKWGRILPAV